MRTWILSSAIASGLVLGIIGLILAQRSRAKETQSPLVQFDKQIADFGVVLPGRLVNTEFAFRNTGSGVLHLSNMTTSCGCTAAKLEQNEYQPGESGAIKVSFQLPHTSDPVSHSVVVQTNDPQMPVAQLLIKADPEWPVAADPEALHIVPVVKGRHTEKIVELYTPSGKSFEVKSIEPSVDWISVEPIRESGRRHVYRIVLNPSKAGHFKEQLVFQTDVPDREKLIIPVAGEIILPSRLVPSRLLLGLQDAGSDVVKKLTLTNCDAETRIDSIKSSSVEGWEILHWDVQRQEDQVSIELRIRVPNKDGYHHGTLVISLGSSTDEMRIPISCLITSEGGLATEKQPLAKSLDAVVPP